MRSTTIIAGSFWLTLGLVAAAVVMHARVSPVGGDTFVMVSPLFFNLAARRATRYRRAAIGIALLGVLLAAAGLAAALSPARPPAP